MSDTDETDRFADLYKAVYSRFHRRVRPDVYRPSVESLAVLRHLSRSGPLTVTEAAAHFERSQSATSEILARLERRGLVERFADGRDRRRTLIWLTRDGLRTYRLAESVLSPRLLEHAFRQMEAADRKKLLEGMCALLETAVAAEGWDDDTEGGDGPRSEPETERESRSEPEPERESENEGGSP